MTPASFADLSHYQNVVDLAAYKSAGHDRIMFKATEGTGFLDSTFTTRWRQAGTLGLRRGAYHFLRNALPAAQQWAWFIGRVRDAGGLTPGDWLCLDSEDTATPASAVECSREFCAAAVRAGFPDGEVYTGRWYANPNGLTAAVFPPGWQRLWMSDYGTRADEAVALPDGWARGQLVARQFTDKAVVPGIGSPCDYNRVVQNWGTEEDYMTQADVDAINAHTDARVTAAQAEILRQLAANLGASAVNNGDSWLNAGIAARITLNERAILAPLMGSEARITSELGAQERRILTAVGDVIANPGVDNADPDAFVAAFRDALITGTGRV